MEKIYHENLLADAGKPIGRQAMVWLRRLEVPLDVVWSAVSTKEGLETWWPVRSGIEIDLKPGGVLRHHWKSTISDLSDKSFIAFQEFRFDLREDGTGTLFSFTSKGKGLDAETPGGWNGAAVGWHGTVDGLETALTSRRFEARFDASLKIGWATIELFYLAYLRDLYRMEQ